jgi:hypothetical protein
VAKSKSSELPLAIQTRLPDFSWSKHTKLGKIYQATTNYTKLPYIMPNGHKIFQMIIKYNNIFHSKALQDLPKLFFFGLKTTLNPNTLTFSVDPGKALETEIRPNPIIG